MTDQIVEFIHMKPIEIRTELREQFAFRKDKKWHWLQRFCLQILKRLGCYAFKFEKSYERTYIDIDKLRDKILEQERSLFKYFNKQAVTLLIGQEDFWQLLDEVDQRFPETFCVRTALYQDYNYYGLNVVVIPWMKGAVVLPEDIVYRGKK